MQLSWNNSVFRNQLTGGIFIAVLFAGAVATAVGLSLPGSTDAAQPKYAILMILMAIVFFGLIRLSGRAVIWPASAVVLLVAMLAGALWPVLVSLWFFVSSLLLGHHIVKRFGVHDDDIGMATVFLVGAGIFGTAVGLLAHFRVNFVGLYGVMLVFPLLIERRYITYHLRNIQSELSTSVKRVDFLTASILSVVLFHFLVALLPEVGFDALAIHLFIPHHMASRHHWGFDPELYAWALMPMLGDWVYTIGYMLAGETAARLINLVFVLVMVLLGRELVLWANGTEKGAKWAALIFLSTPLIYTETNTLFVDSVWAAYMVAGALWLFRYVSDGMQSGRAVAFSGLAFGFSAASKAVTLANLPVFFILLLYRWRDITSRKKLVYLLAALCLFLLFGLIPYVTAWSISGNPVFPFFNEFFKSPFYPEVNFDNVLYKSGVQWDLPYRILFHSEKYLEANSGASGFQWLLLLIPALTILLASRNYRAVLLFISGVLLVVVTFQSQSYLRYVLPSFLILSAVIGVAMSTATASGKRVRVLTLAATATILLNLVFITSGTGAYQGIPLNALFSESARQRYLEERLPVRRAVEFTNYLNSHGTPVAVFSQPFGAGLDADAIYPNWYNVPFRNAVKETQDVAGLVKILSDYGVRFVILDSFWGAEEKRKIIEESTDKIAEFGYISVRTITGDYLYSNELLTNSGLDGSDGWAMGPGAIFDLENSAMRVTVSSNATQSVDVLGGRYYINSVTARCAGGSAQGRLQVNWLDIDGVFISADIEVFECEPDWTEYTMEVISPENAARAVVYMTGHTSTPLEFRGNSLRR